MTSYETLGIGSLFAGDYRILSLLDQGGMGAVYVAEQLSTGQRRALKIMLERMASSPSMRRRFEQEARVAARIRSAHVVQIVGAGVDEPTGHPWLSMELLDGTTLDRQFPLGTPVPWATVALLFEQLGHALSAAHAEGIVHRDLKPENLFLARSHLVGLPFLLKLLDFGIAKVLSEARDQATMMLGSPCWMAPEQLTQGRSVSPATDVWALGLLAFRLFTGRLYWVAAQQDNGEMFTLFHEIGAGRLVPPSERAVELGVDPRQLPPGFDAWFARCVHRTPSERFADASLAMQAFRELLPPGVLMPSGPPAVMASPSLAPLNSRMPPPVNSNAVPSVPVRTIALRYRQGKTSHDFLDAHGHDLSTEGFLLRTKRPLPEGTPVALEIYVGADELIAQGSGTIVAIYDDGMFLRFASLTGPLVDALASRELAIA